MEALNGWMEAKGLTNSGEANSELIYAFESCGTFYAARATAKDEITLHLDQMITGTAGILKVDPASSKYESVVLAIGEVCTFLAESGHDHVLTENAQRRALAHKAKREAAYRRGEILVSNILPEHDPLLADLLPF